MENEAAPNERNEAAPTESARSERDLWVEVVTRMIELTQSGDMEWLAEAGPSGPGRGEPTTPPYYADYKDRRYRLQGRWLVANSLPSSNIWSRHLLESLLGEKPKDREVVTLEMVDGRGRILYRVPGISPIWDLLRAVQKQTIDPEAVLNDLLD